MKKHYIYSISLLFFVLATPTLAQEINYATIEEIKDDRVLLEYSGPSDTSFWLCNINDYDCDNHGSTTPSIFPEIDGSTEYLNSPDGKYAVLEEVDPDDKNSSVYTIYRIGNGWKVKNRTIPYQEPSERITISANSSHVFLFGENAQLARYNIDTHELGTTTLSQTTYPLRIISPTGRFLSAYNYTDPGHRIWDLDEEREMRVPAEKANFVEFSQNEKLAAFVDDSEGFESLYVFDPREDTPLPEIISEDGSTVVDYLFLANHLYFISNSAGEPYKWNLHSYDPEERNVRKISESASYADYIARADGKLIFLTLEGRNTNLSVYDPDNDRVKTIKPLEESPLPKEIQRSVVEIGDNFAALLEPRNKENATDDLFIWLHGGPQRQTSPAYHSYLSYAVYDELLDRLVRSGATVLKLDYTGSWGYGKEFVDALDENIGSHDVKDVISAAKKIGDGFENTYLIGNSYGGYLSARTLVEEPELFAGAISINGVLDWFSLIERIPSSPFARLFNGTPDVKGESNLNLYDTADITKKLDNVDEQKIFLIYGEKDSTVPTWQTTEFYEETKDLDIDTKLLSFPDEDHVLRNRDNLNKLCEEITEWSGLNGKVCED